MIGEGSRKKEAPWFSVYQPSTRLTIVLWEILSLINKVYSDRAGHLNLTLASECTNMGKCMPSQRCTNITHTSHTQTHARTLAYTHTTHIPPPTKPKVHDATVLGSAAGKAGAQGLATAVLSELRLPGSRSGL